MVRVSFRQPLLGSFSAAPKVLEQPGTRTKGERREPGTFLTLEVV